MLLFALLVLSQSADATIQGVVRQAGSLEPVAYATVSIPALNRGVVADRDGYFILARVPQGSWEISAAALGFQPHTVTALVDSSGTVRLEFALLPVPLQVEGIEVTVPARAATTESPLSVGNASGPSAIRVDAAVVERMPVLAEPDVMRALQMLPAVQAASDFSSALYVRGGLPSQNLVLLDGVPLFSPFHLGGLFSAFDPDATESVEILAGAFPARVGDRLSSAVDVRTRDGGRDRVRAAGGIGLISTRATVDGPLPGRNGTFLLAMRRTYLDLVSQAAHAAGLIDASLPYGFDDAQFKITHDVGALGKLSATAYLNTERLGLPAPDFDAAASESSPWRAQADFEWGSRMLSLQYRQPLGGSVLAEFRAGATDFGGEFKAWEGKWNEATGEYSDSVSYAVNSKNVQRDIFAGADFTWIGRRNVHRAGVQIDGYLFDHDVSTSMSGDLANVIVPLSRKDSPIAVAFYLEEEWNVTNRLSARGGIRTLHVGPLGTAWLPRAGIRYALSPTVSVSAGGSRTAQALHSLLNSESIWSSVIAYDLLAALPEDVGLSTARDLTLGMEWNSGGTSLRLDAFTKRMNNLPLAPIAEDINKSPVFVTDTFSLARATSRGLEALATHSRGRTHFSLSYALSLSEVETATQRFNPRFERRHILDISAVLPWGTSGLFSARLAVASGQPTTPVDPGPSSEPPIFGEYNSDRLPGYLRLDVGARRDLERQWFGRSMTITPYLSILNVLNTPNVLLAIPEMGDGAELSYSPQMPIFPTFGVEWSF